MEEEKNMIKGQEGEAFVIREVGKVANYLGKTIRCFNHVILDFDSVYGSRTAELDHIIICGDKLEKRKMLITYLRNTAKYHGI